jgi:uncharacterized membrane protein YhaH (DUF805 family)
LATALRHLGRSELTVAAAMAETTTSQFGRRGVGQAAGAAQRPEATGASSALQAATGWNRSAPASTLPPDMVAAIAKANRTLATGRMAEAAIDRGERAAAPGLITMLFSAKGRIRRRDYWAYSTGAGMVALLALIAVFAALPTPQAMIVAVPLTLLSVFIGLCLQIKRWHDRDKSGVWILIGLAPFVGWFWSFVDCGLLEGTAGPNRYGLSPK